MKRYVAKPPCQRSLAGGDYRLRDSDQLWFLDENERSNVQVVECETDTFSGLYDSDGNELHHVRFRMGFHL